MQSFRTFAGHSLLIVTLCSRPYAGRSVSQHAARHCMNRGAWSYSGTAHLVTTQLRSWFRRARLLKVPQEGDVCPAQRVGHRRDGLGELERLRRILRRYHRYNRIKPQTSRSFTPCSSQNITAMVAENLCGSAVEEPSQLLQVPSGKPHTPCAGTDVVLTHLFKDPVRTRHCLCAMTFSQPPSPVTLRYSRCRSSSRPPTLGTCNSSVSTLILCRLME